MKIYPQQVCLEVTNRCNLRCRYCPNVLNADCNQGKGDFPIGDMDFDFFKYIIDSIDFKCTLLPWLNGEPLLHPQYLDMIKYITKSGIQFYSTTNMTIWNEEFFDYYFKYSTAYQLIISLDGLPGTGSIAKARPGTNEKLVLENLQKLLELKGRVDTKVQLGLKICERGQDWGEIEDYIQYWLSAEEVDFVIVGKALKDINPVSMRTQPCQYYDPKLMLIRWNGQMALCGYNEACVNGMQLSYGTLDRSTSVLEMYNNAYITDLREKQNAGIFPPPCDTCSFAYTGHGYTGEIKFRSDELATQYEFAADYYNTFFKKPGIHVVPKSFYLDPRRV